MLFFYSLSALLLFYALLLLSKCTTSNLCSSASAFVLFYALLFFSSLSALLCSPLFCAFLLIYTLLLLYSSVLTLGRNWTRVSIPGSSLSPTMPSHHRALWAFGDVLGALLSLHSRLRTVKSRTSKVEIIHLKAPTPGAFAALIPNSPKQQLTVLSVSAICLSLQQHYRNLTLIVGLYPWKKWRLDSLKNNLRGPSEGIDPMISPTPGSVP